MWEKFEKVTLKIDKKKTDQLIGPKGKNRKKLEEIYKVSVWVYPKNPGHCLVEAFVSFRVTLSLLIILNNGLYFISNAN